MLKTKMGVTVGAFAALIYFSGLFGDSLIVLLLAGYVLLFEANPWLRRSAVKAVILSVLFSLMFVIIALLPDFLDLFGSLFKIVNVDLKFTVVNSIADMFSGILLLTKRIIFFILALKAAKQGTIHLPFVDGFLNRHLD